MQEALSMVNQQCQEAAAAISTTAEYVAPPSVAPSMSGRTPLVDSYSYSQRQPSSLQLHLAALQPAGSSMRSPPSDPYAHGAPPEPAWPQYEYAAAPRVAPPRAQPPPAAYQPKTSIDPIALQQALLSLQAPLAAAPAASAVSATPDFAATATVSGAAVEATGVAGAKRSADAFGDADSSADDGHALAKLQRTGGEGNSSF